MKRLALILAALAVAGCAASGGIATDDGPSPAAGPGAEMPARAKYTGPLITVYEDAQGWRGMNPPTDRARVMVPGMRSGEFYLR